MDDIDTFNKFGVGVQADHVVVLFPYRVFSKRDALVMAAHIVAAADDGDEFPTILDAVKGTRPEGRPWG